MMHAHVAEQTYLHVAMSIEAEEQPWHTYQATDLTPHTGKQLASRQQGERTFVLCRFVSGRRTTYQQTENVVLLSGPNLAFLRTELESLKTKKKQSVGYMYVKRQFRQRDKLPFQSFTYASLKGD